MVSPKRERRSLKTRQTSMCSPAVGCVLFAAYKQIPSNCEGYQPNDTAAVCLQVACSFGLTPGSKPERLTSARFGSVSPCLVALPPFRGEGDLLPAGH